MTSDTGTVKQASILEEAEKCADLANKTLEQMRSALELPPPEQSTGREVVSQSILDVIIHRLEMANETQMEIIATLEHSVYPKIR